MARGRCMLLALMVALVALVNVIPANAMGCWDTRLTYDEQMYDGKLIKAYAGDHIPSDAMGGLCFERLYVSDDAVLNAIRGAWGRCNDRSCDCQWWTAVDHKGSCNFCRRWSVRVCGNYNGCLAKSGIAPVSSTAC